MPNRTPILVITETAELRGMLDAARRRRPKVQDRKDLLLMLVAAGAEVVGRELAVRRQAVEETAGALSGVYGPAELQRLREDWPDPPSSWAG